jgi:glycosyltransferase involved in cell wall biosynthesis
LRSVIARKWRLFLDNVTAYITPTEFVKRRLVAAGFPERRITAVPNMIDAPESGVDPSVNQYVAYVGRISPEKGIATLLAGAGMTGLRVRIAGDPSPMPEIAKKAPANVEFLGPLSKEDVEELYRGARFVVLPSLWFETFGLVAAEAMSHGVPVIASNMGGLTEVVDDGATGFLFEPGNAEDLANKMSVLWSNAALCRRMGRTAREKVIREYSEDAHYRRLMAVYETAIRAVQETQRA